MRKNMIMKGILDCGKDTEKLYPLLNNVTGSTSTNQILEGMNDQELAIIYKLFSPKNWKSDIFLWILCLTNLLKI